MKLLLACGGTGGHFYPAMGLVEVFSAQHDILMITGRSPMEEELLKGIHVRVERVSAPKIPNGVGSWVKFFRDMSLAFASSLKIIRQSQPDIVIGFGSYASVPVLLAAKLCGRPTLIHEQNIVPGRANRFLSRWVDAIALSFPAEMESWNRRPVKITGNPGPLRFQSAECGIRNAEFKKTHSALRTPHSPLEEGRFTLLIMGGSQGAHRINEYMSQAIPLWLGRYPEQKNQIQLIHITGERDEEQVSKAYQNLPIPFCVKPFYSRMDELYRMAHLVIGRAGATSLAELAYFGIPSILIPYPYAGAHQMENAILFEKEDAAIVIRDEELTPNKLVELLQSFTATPERLNQMKKACSRLRIPDVAERFSQLIEQVVKKI